MSNWQRHSGEWEGIVRVHDDVHVRGVEEEARGRGTKVKSCCTAIRIAFKDGGCFNSGTLVDRLQDVIKLSFLDWIERGIEESLGECSTRMPNARTEARIANGGEQGNEGSGARRSSKEGPEVVDKKETTSNPIVFGKMKLGAMIIEEGIGIEASQANGVVEKLAIVNGIRLEGEGNVAERGFMHELLDLRISKFGGVVLKVWMVKEDQDPKMTNIGDD